MNQSTEKKEILIGPDYRRGKLDLFSETKTKKTLAGLRICFQ